MHLDRRRWGNDIRRAPGLRDEYFHDEDVAAAGEAQDLVHPLADPGEVVGRADGPDEVDAAGCGAGCGGALHKVSCVHEVVGYSCAGGEEDGCAVAGGVGGAGAVGAFDKAWCAEYLVWFAAGEVVEATGHALAGTDDEGNFCGAVSGLEVGV